MRDRDDPSGTQDLNYDPLNRLTEASGDYGLISYGLNTGGDRLSQVAVSLDGERSYSSFQPKKGAIRSELGAVSSPANERRLYKTYTAYLAKAVTAVTAAVNSSVTARPKTLPPSRPAGPDIT